MPDELKITIIVKNFDGATVVYRGDELIFYGGGMWEDQLESILQTLGHEVEVISPSEVAITPTLTEYVANSNRAEEMKAEFSRLRETRFPEGHKKT